MRPYFAPDFKVVIEGLYLEADVSDAVIDLTYDNNLDTADMFSLTLNNGELRFTDSSLFDVGKEVEIHMGYAGALEPMMLGEIASVQPSFPQSGAPTLSISGYDKSQHMRHNEPAPTTFKQMNDSLIAAQIAAENGLVPVVDPSPMPPYNCLQQTGTDWALLERLADRNYFQLYVHWDRLYFRYPRPQDEKIVLEWGRNLSSFEPRLSTATLQGNQVVRSYNQMLAQTVIASVPLLSLDTGLDAILERLGSSVVEQLAGRGRSFLRGQPVNDHLSATEIAKSVLAHLLDGLYEGSGSCIGNPKLRAGELIEIRGVGNRFSGEYRLRSVTHSIGDGGYQTRFEVSQKYSTTLLHNLRKKLGKEEKDEKHYGLRDAKVIENQDPEKLRRVKVCFPDLSDKSESCWIPLSRPAGGKGKGDFALPEIGEPVLVGFINGNIDQPIVVGSTCNLTSPPPTGEPPGQNGEGSEEDTTDYRYLRIIRTAAHLVKLDDTPGKEQLVIQDKTGSVIEMSVDGTVHVRAAGDLVLEAGGNIRIEAPEGNIDVKVQGRMDVS